MKKKKTIVAKVHKDTETDEELKELPLKEFRDFGYLQEVNRQVLHLLGLAMYVETDNETGEATGIGIIDHRDDPEGVFFPNGADREKGERIYKEFMKRIAHRRKLFKGQGPAQPMDLPIPPEMVQEYRAAQENVLNK